MSRLRASSAGLVFLAVLVWLAVPGVVYGQSASNWKAPRTSDGQPDLQGVWLSKSATPLERPKALEGRALLTDEEVAQLQARASRMFKDGNSDFAAGDAVFLAALGTGDRFKSPTSTHNSEDMIEREFDRHTSLIVDRPTATFLLRLPTRRAAAKLPSPPHAANMSRTSTTRSAASRLECRGLAAGTAPATTAITRSCRRLGMSCCSWRPDTRRGSFR
jgi:hypothetical protein